VFFHNLKNYDAHHLLANISDYAVAHRLTIDAIPLNTEKLISFSFSQPFTASNGKSVSLKVQFLDSFQFLPSSLDTLANSLKGQQGGGLDSPAKLAELALPPQEAFFSTLTQTAISDADYAHAQRVWQAFGCATFQDYLDLYMQTDVLLLADVFESFRAFSLTHFRLDPCRYFTLPGLGFDAMLRMTGVRLQLLTSEDQHLFIKRGIRGGVSMISHRAASANNPYMGPTAYDPTQPTSYITYLDANSLYLWAMQQALPTGGFAWVETAELGGVAGPHPRGCSAC
jgi:hypothetical protein